MSEGAQEDGPVALVLAGGGARGAYEVGALSVLLPELESHGQRPTILVGNSVGALNVAFLAAGADRPVGELLRDGINAWKTLEVSSIIGPMVSLAGAGRALGYLGQLIGVPGARLWSLLDSRPLTQTIGNIVDFTRLNRNVTPDGPLEAVALVAMSALTRRSVVFHKGGGTPPLDPYRLIEYVGTDLHIEHVQASAAIPTAFPAVPVQTPPDAAGWYMDGGLRLNTPIKPAIKLGARRIVVVALSSLSQGPSRIAGLDRPDAFAGVSQLVQGMLADTLVQDVHSLATGNEDVKAGRRGRLIYPYIAIAPECNDTIDRIAFRVLRKHYRGLRGLRRSRRIWALTKLIGAGVDVQNPSALSLLLFDPEFVESLIQLGAADAQRWIGRTHTEGMWQIGRM